ncbi:MAG: hypothetical protein EHM36_04165, partial [Deltaproteobacteria bacterium]
MEGLLRRFRTTSAKLREILKEKGCREQWAKVQAEYSSNPVSFIEECCWIFNPDLVPATIPFKLYGYQKDFVLKLHAKYRQLDTSDKHHLLDEKTRQMGMSWLYMAFFLWAILFDPGFSGFVMSYKEDLVDDGGAESTKDSLLGKLRFMYEHLPERFAGLLRFKYLRVSNHRTGAYLVGSSANINAG